MKIIKHLFKVARARARAFGCKHTDTSVASCPYTGLTYTTCNRCYARKAEPTVVNNAE